MKLYDKNRREIMVGDVLKVFHFTGSRRKKHFMYKQVVGVQSNFNSSHERFKISHLTNSEKNGGTYTKAINDEVLEDYEIVQGFGDDHKHFEGRSKQQLSDKGSE